MRSRMQVRLSKALAVPVHTFLAQVEFDTSTPIRQLILILDYRLRVGFIKERVRWHYNIVQYYLLYSKCVWYASRYAYFYLWRCDAPFWTPGFFTDTWKYIASWTERTHIYLKIWIVSFSCSSFFLNVLVLKNMSRYFMCWMRSLLIKRTY